MDENNQQPTNDQPVDAPEEQPVETPASEAPTETPAPEVSAPNGGGAPEEQEMQIGKYKVKIIKSLCIGAASCLAVSPNVYELNSENVAVFKEGATDTDENTLAAGQSCPTKAIIITDTETGQQVWPQ